MTSGNHDVVNFLFCRPQMTGQTSVGSLCEITGIVHAPFQRLLVGPISNRMRAQPTHRGAVATFTTHAIVDRLKGLGALLGPHVQGVAGETLVRLVGGLLQSENLAHAKGNGIRKRRIGTRVLVLRSPDAVLVLGNADERLRLHSTVAVARGAGTGTAVLADFTRLLWGALLLWSLARFYLRRRQQIQG